MSPVSCLCGEAFPALPLMWIKQILMLAAWYSFIDYGSNGCERMLFAVMEVPNSTNQGIPGSTNLEIPLRMTK